MKHQFMRRRRRQQEARNRFLKIAGTAVIAILLFWKEWSYLFILGWVRLRYIRQTSAQLQEANLIDLQPLPEYLLHLVVASLIFIVVLLISNLFNSQYLLPVYSAAERMGAVRSFFTFVFGSHGPLINVRDGEIISHLGEKEKVGPGVVLINSNNAIVVGGRVNGPGIAFTHSRAIGMLMDLRKQVRLAEGVKAVTRDGIEIETDISVKFSITAPPEDIYICLENKGRRADDIRMLELDARNDLIENIAQRDFLPEERQEMFRMIQAMRDGQDHAVPFAEIEKFHAGNYVQERVQTCYNNQPRRPDSGEKVDWRDLPLETAVEEFRNMIVRYPFDDLFVPTDVSGGKRDAFFDETDPSEFTSSTIIASLTYVDRRRLFPLEILRKEYEDRVRMTGFVSYVLVERSDGRTVQVGDRLSDLEIVTHPPVMLVYPRQLRRCEITITQSTFGEIRPTSLEVRNQKVQNLIARWNSDAFRTEVGFEEQAAMIRSRAKAQVQQDTVYALRDLLRTSDTAKTAVILRVFQALEAATVESDNSEMVKMVQMLRDLREWFK
jgi:hypothetical protein